MHLSRHIYHQHCEDPDFVILMKVVLQVEFDLVSCEKMVHSIVEDFPELARWVHWCYGGQEGTCLWFDKWAIDSMERVQRGDPLGPLLFSVVIQRMVKMIAEKCHTLVLHKWYLDDGILGGSAEDVARVLQIISSLGSQLDLNLNPKKCEIISHSLLFSSQ